MARSVAALVALLATVGAGKAPAATGVGDASVPALVAQLTSVQANVRFAQLYKLRYLDAKSVAAVLRRSFAGIQVTIVADVNGLSIVANAAQHQRIADALNQLDLPGGAKPPVAAPVPVSAAAPPPGGGATGVDVVTLHAAIPGINGVQSSSASDIASAVMQALSPSLPDLRITIYAGQSQLLLTGSPNTIRIARELIDKLDALQKMVVLDVTILEVDESTSKDLGLSLLPAVISTTYTETTPAAPANGGAAPPLLGLQQLSRTPLSLGVQLNLLIQNGKAKVLADPKLTTISGRTASLRAGDNIAILTTTGGSVGTVATTQLQTFNTGVQLDITPVINAENFISVTLHPTVNNLSSILNGGVPQISTRDVQTTVALREGQSLIIGGLIEDSYNRSEQKIPVLGYLPLVGPLFTQTTISGQRNELIITVTPHIIDPLAAEPPPLGPAMTTMPSPAALPTLAPTTVLPLHGSGGSSFIALPGEAPSGDGTLDATAIDAHELARRRHVGRRCVRVRSASAVDSLDACKRSATDSLRLGVAANGQERNDDEHRGGHDAECVARRRATRCDDDFTQSSKSGSVVGNGTVLDAQHVADECYRRSECGAGRWCGNDAKYSADRRAVKLTLLGTGVAVVAALLSVDGCANLPGGSSVVAPTPTPTASSVACLATASASAQIVAISPLITATPDPTFGIIAGYGLVAAGNSNNVAAPIVVLPTATIQFFNNDDSSSQLRYSAVGIPGATSFPAATYTFPPSDVAEIGTQISKTAAWSTGLLGGQCYSQPFTIAGAGTYYFGDYTYYGLANLRDVIVATTSPAPSPSP